MRDKTEISVHKDRENVYAYDQTLKEVFVKDARNGRNLYSCMGCKREVILVKRESFWHFRHYVENESNNEKCTYRDETYRHQIAKEILQIHKKIKVPTLYKFPPLVSDGYPRILKSSEVIQAHSVKNEVYFYETNEGELKWGKKDSLENMNFLIRADSVFFDKNNIPFLLIEFNATSKLDDEKQAKLRRLNINTIQVSIPIDSPEAIENSILKDTSRTKWIYNNEEQDTDYFSVSSKSEDRIHKIDSNQRGFFEESYKCRKARINNLIYSIGKSLESEQYLSIRSGFESEIKRVEGFKERFELDKERHIEEKRELEREEEHRRSIEHEEREIEHINSIIKAIEDEDYEKLQKEDFIKIGFGSEYKEFFDERELLHDFEKEKRNNTRIRTAKELFSSGAWKTWFYAR